MAWFIRIVGVFWCVRLEVIKMPQWKGREKEYHKDYMRKRRARMREIGLCPCCGQPLPAKKLELIVSKNETEKS